MCVQKKKNLFLINTQTYKNMCRDAGIPVYEHLIKQLTNDEDREEFMQTQQVKILAGKEILYLEQPYLLFNSSFLFAWFELKIVSNYTDKQEYIA
jgi:pantothenate kinase